MQTSTGLPQTQTSLSDLCYSSDHTISTDTDIGSCTSNDNECTYTDTDMDKCTDVGNDCTPGSHTLTVKWYVCAYFACTCRNYYMVCRMMLCALTDCFRVINLTFLALQTIWRVLLVAIETRIHQKPLFVMLNSFSINTISDIDKLFNKSNLESSFKNFSMRGTTNQPHYQKKFDE